ncbi:MAG: hypothetical protein V4436_01560 [Patescibacteria group bacterium]
MYRLWESIQKARKAYTCDLCSDWIYVGDVYTRTVMRVNGKLEVFREHSRPGCPREEPDDEVVAEVKYLQAA